MAKNRKIQLVAPIESEKVERPQKTTVSSNQSDPQLFQNQPTDSQGTAHSVSDKTNSNSSRQVLIHYPNPTWISTVVQEMSKSLGWVVIMDPGLDRKIQIFCTTAIDEHQAEFILNESLRTVGLRLLKNSNNIMRIAAKRDQSLGA